MPAEHHALPIRFRWYLVALFAAGGFSIVCAQLDSLHGTLWGEIARDIGMALCISVVVAIIIEISLSRETYLRGLDAIMQRTVEDDVWQEFRQHVIREPLMREGWSVHMALQQQADGRFVSTTELKYKIIGLTDRLKTTVSHELDSHRSPPDRPNARFTDVASGGLAPKNASAIATLVSNEGLTITLPVRLAKHRDTMDVAVAFDEVITCPDVVTWWMSRVTRNLALEISGIPDTMYVEVKTFHPSGNELEKDPVKPRWKFTGVMLSGQGFEVRLKKKEARVELPAAPQKTEQVPAHS